MDQYRQFRSFVQTRGVVFRDWEPEFMDEGTKRFAGWLDGGLVFVTYDAGRGVVEIGTNDEMTLAPEERLV